MKLNRRNALKAVAVSGATFLLESAKAQNLAAYRIADMAVFEPEGAIAQFPFDGRHGLVLQIGRAHV